ncbi:restriction endonuclease subunit S [Ruegeria sp. HKCCE3926]|uniref:restriction endonuclease subunit S n=1 Tax=Ruegeria sp. HKCCE3926 TaxID=2794831 RepID=UPI001AE9A3DA|nr:restriction endonuclease subunit S [Ruegeria sp. HKCCE3926]
MSFPSSPLSEVSEIQIGPFGSLLHKADYVEDGVPVINPMHIAADGISADPSFSVSELKAKDLQRYLLKTGEVIMGRRGEMGRCAVVESQHEGMICGTGSMKIIPSKSALHSPYLVHILRTPKARRELAAAASGVTMLNLNAKSLAALKIPLPPLEEQKRIAGILDQADALRRLRSRARDKLNTLGQAIFHEMFGDPTTNPMGWESVKLGDLCNVGSSKRVFVSEFVESGVPFFRGTEVGKLGDGKIVEPELFISAEHYEGLVKQSGKPEIGDLLLPSICHGGRIWKVDDDKPFYFKDGRVLWIKCHSAEINSEYLRNHLRNIFLFNYSSIASGTTFAELKIVNLKNLSLLNPPIELQNEFASRIASVETSCAHMQRSASYYSSLFNSLQDRAFRGEL